MTETTLPLFDPESQSTKICTKCGIEKPLSEFHNWKRSPDGHKPSCKYCRNKENKEYTSKNKDKIRAASYERYWSNPEKARVYGRALHMKHKKAQQQYNAKYYIENRERILNRTGAYAKDNRESLNEYWRKRRASDQQHRLKKNIACAMYLSLVGNKQNRHWETLVDFTLQDLKKHLEKQFTEGMTWENYGEWHIDHKIPLAVHNFISAEDLDFKRAWALKNLQPLWAKDNMIKHDKIDEPFQPSLAFGGAL